MARVSEALFSSAVSGTEYKSKVYIYLMAFFRSAWFAINHWPQRMTITLARSFVLSLPTHRPTSLWRLFSFICPSLFLFLLHRRLLLLLLSSPVALTVVGGCSFFFM